MNTCISSKNFFVQEMNSLYYFTAIFLDLPQYVAMKVGKYDDSPETSFMSSRATCPVNSKGDSSVDMSKEKSSKLLSTDFKVLRLLGEGRFVCIYALNCLFLRVCAFVLILTCL